jgi:hypothetical protein
VTRRQFIAITIMLAVPAVGLAHPGHAHKTMGVVTVIHENHLEVKDAQGKATTFTLDAKTRIRRGKSLLKIADIKTGDRVVVVSNESKGKDGKSTVTVTEVQLGTAQ